MDTRLRNNDGGYAEEYARGGEKPPGVRKALGRLPLGGLALVLALLAGISCIFISAANLAAYGRAGRMEEFLNPGGDKVLDFSGEIQEELQRYAKNLHRYYVYFGGEKFGALPEGERVTEADLAGARAELARQFEEESSALSEKFAAYGDGMPYDQLMYGQKMDEALKLSEKYSAYADPQALYERALAAKNANYDEVRQYLDGQQAFGYCVTGAGGLGSFSNIPGMNAGNMPRTMAVAGPGYYAVLPLDHHVFYNAEFTGMPLAEAFARDNITGYIFLKRGGHDFGGENASSPTWLDYAWESSLASVTRRDYSPQYWAVLIAGLVITAASAVLALRYLEKARQGWRLLCAAHSWLPFTAKLGGAAAAAVILFDMALWPADIAARFFDRWAMSEAVVIFLVLMCALAAVPLTAGYAVRLARNPSLLRREPEAKLAGLAARDFGCIKKSADFTVWALYALVTLAALVLAVIIFSIGMWDSPALLLYAVLLPLWLLAHAFLCSYARLVWSINLMAAGGVPDAPEAKGLFSAHLRRLGQVGDGMSAAVADMMKSERLKSELITNVSHDLKTPLTSIINYVSLLKALPGQEPQAAEYIGVLERKSERLGALIEDLFEASKLQSGSVELARGRLDLVGLLNQAIGELDEKIAASGVDFRFTHAPEHIYYDCDGKMLWRAFDNLLTNIIKYSPRGSRAYIAAATDGEGATLTFKNVSAYELDADPSELFNRFKRGDASRATEGSGLGLAIARGIIELHGGKMGIEVDGDLFKVTVRL